MSTRQDLVFGLLCLTFYCFSSSLCADIRKLSIPRWIRNGTGKGVVLDCEYTYNENDLRLVVKWFFNDDLEPIYQWIPELKIRHVAGQLYGRLDMEFSINPLDPYSQYRALRINSVTPDLSGKYTCVVTSLAGQDLKFQIMKVFVPATRFQFTFSMGATGKITFSCLVEGVYPEPTMKLNVLNRKKFKKFQKIVAPSPSQAIITRGAVAEIVKRANSSVYDGLLVKTIDEDQMIESSLGSDTFVECILEIPDSPYKRKRRITYIPGSRYTDTINSSSLPSILNWFEMLLYNLCFIIITAISNKNWMIRSFCS